jgi:hypothetical protein
VVPPCLTAAEMKRTDVRILTAGGNHLKTTTNGVVVPDYAKVQGILIGVVAAFLIIITLIGPECVSCPPCPSKYRTFSPAPCPSLEDTEIIN